MKQQMPSAKALGIYVARARRRCGLKQIELANKLGVSQPFLSKVENGRRVLNIQQWWAFCVATRIFQEMGGARTWITFSDEF